MAGGACVASGAVFGVDLPAEFCCVVEESKEGPGTSACR